MPADIATVGEAPSSRGGGRALTGSLAGLFLGGVFLVAVWGKMLDPVAFAEVIAAEHVDVLVGALPLAYLALAIEAGVGFAFVLNLRRAWVLLPTAGLVLFFLFLNGRAYVQYLQGVQPEVTSCGCFGHLLERTPAEAFWQDAVLLVPALALSFLGRPGAGRPGLRLAVTAVLAAAVTGFAVAAPDLPLDDLATKLSPGDAVSEVCAGTGNDRVCLGGDAVAPELREGRRIVVLADLTDEAFASAVGDRLDELLAWTSDAEHPSILVLHPGGKTEEGAFQFRARSPPLEYRAAPRSLLRPLYRRLPRTVLVEGGRVARTFDGFPPLSQVDP